MKILKKGTYKCVVYDAGVDKEGNGIVQFMVADGRFKGKRFSFSGDSFTVNDGEKSFDLSLNFFWEHALLNDNRSDLLFLNVSVIPKVVTNGGLTEYHYEFGGIEFLGEDEHDFEGDFKSILMRIYA